MGKAKAEEKLWREFERAQTQFLTDDNEPEPEPPEREDVAAYRAGALRAVADLLAGLGEIVPVCELDSDLCEVCLGLRIVGAMRVLDLCVERLAMLAEVDRVLG